MRELDDNEVYYKYPYQSNHYVCGVKNWISQNIYSLHEHNFRQELLSLEIL